MSMNSRQHTTMPPNELFPLLARFAQEIRSPLTFITVQVVESAAEHGERMVELSALTVSHTGASSRSSTLVAAPEQLADEPVSRRLSGLRDTQAGSPFAPAYEGICKAFLSSLVIGFGSSKKDIALLLRLMTANGAPALSPKAHLDLQSTWWSIQKADAGDLSAAATMYGVAITQLSRGNDVVTAMARTCEEMLWRHGFDLLAGGIVRNEYPYATAAVASEAASSQNAQQERPRRERKRDNTQSRDAELKARIRQHLQGMATGEVPTVASLAQALGATETNTSMVLGQLIAQKQIAYIPFIDPAAQLVLDERLPAALAAHGHEKLKPLKEHIEQQCSGVNVDYIQLRIALLNRNLLPSKSPRS